MLAEHQPDDLLLRIGNLAIGNGQVTGASECAANLLPKFLKANRSRITPDKIVQLKEKVLQYSPGYSIADLESLGYSV